jgi:hypothetical protein
LLAQSVLSGGGVPADSAHRGCNLSFLAGVDTACPSASRARNKSPMIRDGKGTLPLSETEMIRVYPGCLPMVGAYPDHRVAKTGYNSKKSLFKIISQLILV